MHHEIHDLMLVPSLRCNYQCPHCCRSSSPHRKEHITQPVLGAVRHIMANYCVTTLTISGGEPFILSQTTWEQIFDTLAYGDAIEDLCVITNGAWAKSPRKRLWFCNWWVPNALRIMNQRPDLGLMVELSNDQYHPNVASVARYWQLLRTEAEQGYIDDLLAAAPEGESWDDYEGPGFFTPLDESIVHLGLHGKYIYTVQPLGRGKELWWDHQEDAPAHCDVEADESDEEGEPWYQHQLSVFPDGRISGCCGGGGWVGNLLTMPLEQILDNQVALYLENKRCHKKGDYGVKMQACIDCRATAHRLFGTYFKEA
jgi:hypothetical protein